MGMHKALESANRLYVQQKKNWSEILIDFEAANRYAVLNEEQDILGMVAEEGTGLGHVIKRWILRSHRGFEASVVENDGSLVLRLSRAFFFFFSDIFVTDAHGKSLGSVHRRFGIIFKKYDLRDGNGMVFASIKSPLWRLWTFPIKSHLNPVQGAEVAKKWSGAMRELFTDADTFKVDFGIGGFSYSQRAVIFAAAISIDFDFFEENQGFRN